MERHTAARGRIGRTACLLIGGGAALFASGAASAGPAMAQQLRKSPVSDLAAGATTVADRLSELNGVGSPSVTISGGFSTGHIGHQGRHHGDHYGNGGFDFDIDDPRLRRGWDPSHYGDEKRHDHTRFYGQTGGRYSYSGGYSTGYGYRYNPWNNREYWDVYPYGVDGRLVSGVQPGSQLRMPAPSTPAVQVPPPEPETDIDAARRLASSDAFDGAVDRYRAHLFESPDDFSAMAELALALAGSNRPDDAAAMTRLAYGKDPTLASRPIDGRVAMSPKDLRKIVVRAVRFAHDRDSASAWLLVAVLMQAEGRDPVGLRMIDRAADRGLPSDISDAMSASLR